MSNAETPADTKLALILAAGELFADRGLEGVSIRDIVGKAGATLSSVNYHFGSKSGLYLQAIRYALQRHINVEDTLTQLEKTSPSNSLEMAEVVYGLVHRFFRTYLAPEHPRWYERLINRAVVDGRDDVSLAIAEVLRPADEMLHRLLLQHVPNLGENDAGLWRMCLSGQIHYFLMARGVINQLLNRTEDEYDEEFIENAAAYVARNMVLVLGLPLPASVAPLSCPDNM